MKKLFSILLTFCLTLGLSTLCIAAEPQNNNIEPYDIITKTVTGSEVVSYYVSQLNTTVKIKYTLTGYYTCDRASGEIKSAYKCTLNSVELAETPAGATSGIDSFNVSAYSFTPYPDIVNGNAVFSASIAPRLIHNRSGILAHDIILSSETIKITATP